MSPSLISTKYQKLYIYSIIVIVSLVFFPSLFNDFLSWDDAQMIKRNPYLKELSLENVSKIFTSPFAGRYYPLTFFSWQIDYHFFKLDPYPYHMINLILHLFNVVLVYRILLLLKVPLEVALLATAMFGIHPMNVEAVAWISSRKDLLSAFFYFLAVMNYCLFSVKGRRAPHLLASFIFFVISLLAKPMAVTFPLTIIILDCYYRNKLTLRSILNKWPFFITTALFCMLTLHVFYQNEVFPADSLYTNFERVPLSAVAGVLYFVKCIIPYPLACLHPLPEHVNGFLPVHYYLTLFLIPFVLFIFLKIFKQGFVKLITLNAFITLLPALHLSAVNTSLIYERFIYTPSVSIFLLMSAGLYQLYHFSVRGSKIFSIVVRWGLIMYLLFLSLLTWDRCLVWKNDNTLWSDVIKNILTEGV